MIAVIVCIFDFDFKKNCIFAYSNTGDKRKAIFSVYNAFF